MERVMGTQTRTRRPKIERREDGVEDPAASGLRGKRGRQNRRSRESLVY